MLDDDYLSLAPAGIVADCNMITLCTGVPATYTEATTTSGSGGKMRGSKPSPTLSVVDGSPSGKALRVLIFTDGVLSDADAVGTDQYIALVKTSTSKLIGTFPIVNDQVLISGNNWSLSTISIWTILDAAPAP